MCTGAIKNRKPYLLKMNSSHYVTLSESLKGLKLFRTFTIEVMPGWKCFSNVALISDIIAREYNETFKSVQLLMCCYDYDHVTDFQVYNFAKRTII